MQCVCVNKLCPNHSRKCKEEAKRVIEVNGKRYHVCQDCFKYHLEVKRGMHTVLED